MEEDISKNDAYTEQVNDQVFFLNLKLENPCMTILIGNNKSILNEYIYLKIGFAFFRKDY